MSTSSTFYTRALPLVKRGIWIIPLTPHDKIPLIKNLIEKTVASGLIYLNSHVSDFKNPQLRPYLDLYMRGSGGVDAEGRVKLMKLLWDAIGTEFGGRHELYEINYSGSHEEIRRYALFGALASGQYDRWKQFAETCMAEYDLDGWKAKDLVDTSKISALP
jgi:4-hydroxyphenylacetate 3-monooxygenase